MNKEQVKKWQRQEAKIERRMREWGISTHTPGNPNNKGLFILSHLIKYGYIINYYSVEDLEKVENLILQKWNKRNAKLLKNKISSNAKKSKERL